MVFNEQIVASGECMPALENHLAHHHLCITNPYSSLGWNTLGPGGVLPDLSNVHVPEYLGP